ncbi:hypothetical protein [Actinoplanes sp. NPDC049316]|uniref:hypothetical protein n=1 Tax=Actinoplanes sp. NPDC049316 TaxID=3154727 RepID=UPI003415281A
MISELTLFADYHQIHLFDEGSSTDLGDAWTGGAVDDQLAAADDAMAVGTAANMDVSVTVDVRDQPPADDVTGFDHVVEGSLRASSGRVVVMGCTDFEPDAARFSVAPGWVRIRVAKSNLAAAYDADNESDDDPATMERLTIQIWPAAHAPVAVLKRWTRQGS